MQGNLERKSRNERRKTELTPMQTRLLERADEFLSSFGMGLTPAVKRQYAGILKALELGLLKFIKKDDQVIGIELNGHPSDKEIEQIL